MELTDTHCHLQFEKYHNREDEVLANASKAGVKRFICVGTSLADSQSAAEIAKVKENVWATAGSHPHEAAKFLADQNSSKQLTKLAALPRIVAIGETGLDYYKQYSAKDDQQTALRTHLGVGIELGLPFVFHVRDAWEDFWHILSDYKGIKGVVHSFSTHPNHLEEVISRGLYVGLNGIMTFTQDEAQLATARAVPLNRLLLETDAPFLTPAPSRGELCEPKHVRLIAEFLAELRGEPVEELAKATTQNAIELFSLEKQ